MTEGCGYKTKFTDKINTNNYCNYIAGTILLLSVLYFYRFLFAIICFGLAVGGLACYFGLNSSWVHDVLEDLKIKYAEASVAKEEEKTTNKSCTTCGLQECPRHDYSITTDPWNGLKIHKQLDQAIEEFYNTILENFVCSWYCKITLQPFFIDELRHQLRYASACLLRRAIKINYSKFITERLLPCALHHYTLCADMPEHTQLLDSKLAVHPAASNRNAELKYLRSITNAIMPYLLKTNDLQNSVFRVLVRELFAGWVLLSLTDVLADPEILNALVLLAVGPETMAPLPDTPDYYVEFLETFARQSDTLYLQRSKLLRLDLEQVLDDQQMFYAFMQHLKTTGRLHLLQFYKDINAFQTKLLNPAICDTEKACILREAQDIYETYFNPTSGSRVDLDPSLVEDMKCLLDRSDSCIKNLQTSKALYQAARQSHAALEKLFLPRFLHSEEFYNLYIGSRIPTGYHKQMTKKPQDRLMQSAAKLSNKLKSAMKPQILDGQVLDSIPSDLLDADSDSVNILKYLDYLASEDSLKELDLSSYKVVLTDVDNVEQAPPRRGCVRVFSLAVHRALPAAAATLLTVRRSEHDFHLLNGKLLEFHRHVELGPLPSRRDNSPLETLRYKYEDYLQRILQQPILQSSELLHLFLTVEGDFSLAVQASSLSNSTDLLNIYQSVAHRLKKEKGQHLDSFLRNFMVSSDMERYQALKMSTTQVEEAQEVNEEAFYQPYSGEALPGRESVRGRGRAAVRGAGVFGDNFGIEARVETGSTGRQGVVAGFTQCTMYILIKVVCVHPLLSGVAGTVFSLTRGFVDIIFDSVLGRSLKRLLCQRRLAHLIRLGQVLLFNKKVTTKHEDPADQHDLARARLLASIPSGLTLVAPRLPQAVANAFDLLQVPQLNKQLVYELLDLCLSELFPELVPDSERPS